MEKRDLAIVVLGVRRLGERASQAIGVAALSPATCAGPDRRDEGSEQVSEETEVVRAKTGQVYQARRSYFGKFWKGDQLVVCGRATPDIAVLTPFDRQRFPHVSITVHVEDAMLADQGWFGLIDEIRMDEPTLTTDGAGA